MEGGPLESGPRAARRLGETSGLPCRVVPDEDTPRLRSKALPLIDPSPELRRKRHMECILTPHFFRVSRHSFLPTYRCGGDGGGSEPDAGSLSLRLETHNPRRVGGGGETAPEDGWGSVLLMLFPFYQH